MDLSTFYAVVAGTCFTLVGLWWNVVERRPDWLADPHLRRLVGGVYVSFLLPALMSLFAQIDPSEPLIWRITFVIASAIGAWSTLSLIRVDRQVTSPGIIRKHRWLVAVVYGLVAVLGVVPDARGELRPDRTSGRGVPAGAAGRAGPRADLGVHDADPRGGHRSIADHRGLTGQDTSHRTARAWFRP